MKLIQIQYDYASELGNTTNYVQHIILKRFGNFLMIMLSLTTVNSFHIHVIDCGGARPFRAFHETYKKFHV